jgi:crotonobetainyl-CoA:carnitine CoA-transferase CaiB-like acyl-CoA transferase
MREMPPLRDGTSVLFESLNRNKRSVHVDPRTEQGRHFLHDLVRSADVVLEGGRPGAMESLGADYESLRAVKPDLVYCSLSGYGQRGPYRDLPSHGANLDAAAGVAPITVRSDGTADVGNIRIFVASQAGALHAALSIAAALVRRASTGLGCYLDVSGFDAAVSWQYGNLTCLTNTGEIFAGSEGMGPRYGCYRTADDRWVFLAAMEPKFWRLVCEAAGHPELSEGVDDDQALEWGTEDERPRIATMMVEHSQSAWVYLATRLGLPVSPVNLVDDLPDDPHLESHELIVCAPDTGVHMVAFPVRTDDEAFEVRRRAPRFGEHTAEILDELAGREAR